MRPCAFVPSIVSMRDFDSGLFYVRVAEATPFLASDGSC